MREPPQDPGRVGQEPSPKPGRRAALQQAVVDDIRTVSYRSQRLASSFAEQQSMHPTDLEALVHVMHGENAGLPLTAGALAGALSLSTPATTSVIDRLERAGHLQRERDTTDRRRVHLRTTPAAMTIAGAFFGPLGLRTDAVMDTFTTDELAVVHRFLQATTDAVAATEEEHRAAGAFRDR